ncbi:MAG: hypothetical protein K6F79_08295 [Saccharofermentans sp.]|nr:hypothetical protein [Saccharofermentans sp.]
MALEQLDNYGALIVDYSFIKEFGATTLLTELLDIATNGHKDVYVSKAFKLLHYCVIHQADDISVSVSDAMREFAAILLPEKLLHSFPALNTEDFFEKTSQIPNACIVTASTGIFIKRIREKLPAYIGDICVISPEGDINYYHGISELLADFPAVEISPLATLDKYLDAPVNCNVGDTVVTSTGKRITLEKRLSAGAEGMVFTTNDPKIVAKIYHKGIITPLRWKKLQTQVKMGINAVGLCWPKDLISYRGVPVGYTMIMGKGRTLGNVFDGPDALLNSFPNWKRIDIVSTLADILEKYIYLHMNGIIAGDIQMKNALIYSANAIYLIDMDSVQVENLPCPVGTEEFTDPRLWGTDFASFLRKLEDEDYSIAMLVFSLLFCGLHPYATRNGAETLREEILNKKFPYELDNSSDDHIPKGGYNYIWEYLPEDIRTMLYGTFREGKSFEALKWYETVVNYKEALSSEAYEDPEAYKAFPKMDYVATNPDPVVKPRFTPAANATAAPTSPFAPKTQPSSGTSFTQRNGQGNYNKFYINTDPVPKPDDKKKTDTNGGKNDGGLRGLFKNRR